MWLNVSPGLVSAHGSEASWEIPSGAYTVDIGYEPEVFVADAPVRFDLGLRSGETSVPYYTHIWVRVVRGTETQFATGVMRQPVGPTTLLYAPGEAGEYEFEVSYRDEESKEIARASFPFTVTSAKTQSKAYTPLVGWLLAGATLGATGVWFLRRRP